MADRPANHLATASALELDDEFDREELRGRYYGLMQELRTLLPGVQVLVAFLLTVPFAERFSELDDLGKNLFGLALVSAILSVVAFMTPTALHRIGRRTARSKRLHISIRLTRAGMLLVGVAILSSLAVVARLIFGNIVAVTVVSLMGVVMLGLWLVLPLGTGRGRPMSQDEP